MPANPTKAPLDNPFARPGETPPNTVRAPRTNPFAPLPLSWYLGPPEPTRTPEAAKLEARRRARIEWEVYLPHGLPRADYEPLRMSEVRHTPVLSATIPLRTSLPPDEVAACAEAIADDTFVEVADLYTTHQPAPWLHSSHAVEDVDRIPPYAPASSFGPRSADG